MTMSYSQRAEFFLASSLMNLPHWLQIRASGNHPIMIDGQTLAPDIQLLLALRKIQKAKSFSDLPVEKARKALTRDAAMLNGRGIPVHSVRNLEIPDGERKIPARLYSAHLGMAPLLIFLHGGGFSLGNLETHDLPCRFICDYLKIHVLSIDYRLAPEHKFPAAIEDTVRSFIWAMEEADHLRADPEKIIVGGDSAGGNLAAVATHILKEKNLTLPAAQFLIYPTTDRTREYPSLRLFEKGFFLTRKDIDWFGEFYNPGESYQNARISPLLNELSGLPPTLVLTAGFDPLRDEGEAFAHKLMSAGVNARLMRAQDQIHGFINMTEICPSSKIRFREALDTLKALVGI